MDDRKKNYAAWMDREEQRDPTFNRATVRAVFELLTTYDMMHTRFSRMLDQYGLTPAGYNVLAILRGVEGQSYPMHQLSNQLLVSRQNITQIVDALESKGLAERVPNPDDRRGRLVQLTATGKQLIETVAPRQHANHKAVMSALREPEIELFTDYLERIQARLLELRASECPEAARSSGPTEPDR
jgi:DNA-binding MarR family transcriptional regulator